MKTAKKIKISVKKKPAVKKVVKKINKKKPAAKKPKEKKGGEVTHFFGKINVAVLKLNAPLKIGDKVHFTGSADFKQTVESLQIDHKDVRAVKKGRWVGMKVEKPVKEKDAFSKI